jgi:RNA polymerase sigma-70 factor (ECF subfamily)
VNRVNTRALARDLDLLFGGGTAVGLPDGDLLARFVGRSGKPAELAFAALVARHGPMVLRVCGRVLSDPHDVEDAFQATFLVLVERAESIRTRDSVASWLHGVAFRVASCARATAARRRRLEASRPELEYHAGETDDPRELRLILQEEIARLPDRYRAALVLCDLEGHTYDEAARQLVWPIGTVKSRLARARQRLRVRLVRRGVAPAALALSAALAGEAATSLPITLRQATIRAATELAAGRPFPPGAVPASVIALTEGVLKTMFLTKLKTAALTLLVLGALATGAAVRGQGDGDARPRSEPDRLRDIEPTGAAVKGQGDGDARPRSEPDRLRDVERKLDRLIDMLNAANRPHRPEGDRGRLRTQQDAPQPEAGPARSQDARDRPERETPRPRVARSLRDSADHAGPQPKALFGRPGLRIDNDRIGILERRIAELEARFERLERRLDAAEHRGSPANERRGVDQRGSDRAASRRAAAEDGSTTEPAEYLPEPAELLPAEVPPSISEPSGVPRDPSKR